MSEVILLTAFQPFDIDPENSSAMVLENLQLPQNVVTGLLPVSFAESWIELQTLIKKHDPATVLGLGQADRREKIGIEQVALNVIDARIQDETGVQPVDQTIRPGEPLARSSNLPTRQLLMKLQQAGIQSEISFNAGTFVCNTIMYHILSWADATQRRAGFVHLPLLVEQRLGKGRARVGTPTLTLSKATLAVQLLLSGLNS